MNDRPARYSLLSWAALLIGFTAVVAQIVLMRELIVVFHGNEISLGLILACWMFWTAIGSGLVGRLVADSSHPGKAVAGLQAAIALVFPLTILAVRTHGFAAGATPGELAGPASMFFTSFVALSAVCALSGCLFAAAGRLYVVERGRYTDQATSAVYCLEALGSGVGGILTGVLLIRWLSSLEIAAVVSMLNLFAASLLAIRTPGRRLAAVAGVAGIFAGIVLPVGVAALDNISLRYLWRGLDVVETRESIYENLTVVSTGASMTVFGNGVAQFTVPDPAAAEEAVHFALLQHPAPESMLLVGGGVGGALAEALKHSTLSRVDYVELDPAVLELGRELFAESWLPVQSNTRVDINRIDGRRFLQGAGRSYDVIVINLPDPQTAQLNRFYTLEFFQEAADRLAPAGVFSFQLGGAENYVSDELASFLRCVYRTLCQVFTNNVVIPGGKIHFFAGGDQAGITADPAVLVERLRERGVVTRYVREYFFPFRMTPDRMVELRSQLEADVWAPVNKDFEPVAYYFDVVLWSTRFHQGYRRFFQFVGEFAFGGVVTVTSIVFLILVTLTLILRRDGRRLGIGAGACVGSMGFTMIGLQVMVLLAFQAVFGYVYHQLALLIAVFMAGMALGSWLSIRRFSRDNGASPESGGVRVLLTLQLVAVLLPLALYGVIAATSRVVHPAGAFVAGNIVYPALAFISGWVGGYQFPVASRFFFRRALPSSSPGSVYAIDVAGACVGAILFSAYLIPVFGFLKTAVLMAVVNTGPAVLIAWPGAGARGESGA